MTTLDSLFSLKGKVALVTGASSGLGVEFAKALGVAGADVAVVARRAGRLETLAKEMEQSGGRCLPVAADLSDEAQIDQAIEKVESELGKLDILVNNAGIAHVGRAEEHALKDWNHALEINLTVPFLMAQRAARSMIERGEGGRIINISSGTSVTANSIFKTVGYAASKGGVRLLTQQLAVEWAKHEITVNAIAPGWFPTEMNIDPEEGDIKSRFKERMELLTPMGRLGRKGELMGAMIYLASPAASFVTGTTLFVDGGWVAW